MKIILGIAHSQAQERQSEKSGSRLHTAKTSLRLGVFAFKPKK